jgi:tetraprenyl-beta-curcumene synthase
VLDSARRTVTLAHAFTSGASRYWIGVFPDVNRELRCWRERAMRIPSPELRRLAVLTHRGERGNLEGAAAFATLVPRRQRAAVVRATVAFQALYDFLDTLAEQVCVDPVANGHGLHLALLAALDSKVDEADYYHYYAQRDDGGYVLSLIAACRAACAELPSYERVRVPALRAARRMVSYQALTHCQQRPGWELDLARWAQAVCPSGLCWWEAAAGAASSLGVFALIAEASHPRAGIEEVARLEAAYFPWIGALHVLLDSLIDREDDRRAGHHSLIAHYADEQLLHWRLVMLAARSIDAARAAPRGASHVAILAAMVSFYMSSPDAARDEGAARTGVEILRQLGVLAAPAMGVLRARRRAGRLLELGPLGRRAAPGFR